MNTTPFTTIIRKRAVTYDIPVPDPEWPPGKLVLEALKSYLASPHVDHQCKKRAIVKCTKLFELPADLKLTNLRIITDWKKFKHGMYPDMTVWAGTNKGWVFQGTGTDRSIGADRLSLCLKGILAQETELGALLLKALCEADMTTGYLDLPGYHTAGYHEGGSAAQGLYPFPMLNFGGQGLESFDAFLKRHNDIEKVYSMHSGQFDGYYYSNTVRLTMK